MEIVGQTVNGKLGTASRFTVFDDCTSTSTWTEKDSDGTLSTTGGAIQIQLSNKSGEFEESAYLVKNLKNKGAFLINLSGIANIIAQSGDVGTAKAYIELKITDGSSETILKSQQICESQSAGGVSGGAGGGGMISAHLVFKAGKVIGIVYSTGAWCYNTDYTPHPGGSSHNVTSVDEDLSAYTNVYLLIQIRTEDSNNDNSTTITAQTPYILKLDNFQNDWIDDV